MSSVDNRIVNMQFNNKNFESNVKDTMKSLQSLEKSLKLQDGTKGLEDVEKASRSFSMDSVASAVESIADRFSTLGIIGMTALQSLTNSAIDLGKKLVSAIYGPLVEGGKQRALNIEQAKFQFEGLGIDVEKAMAAASYAVNDTAYSLDSAAKAAAQFAASGLEDFDEMGTALRAISGVAAMTSSSYDDIANVFTSVAGNGRLMGQQLLQLSSRGINAAATLATYLGKSEAEVRKMVSAGQISFELFYTAMDDAFGEHAKKANETFSGSMANVRANLSRIGADVATQSLESFKNVNNALIPVLKELHKALGPAITAVNEFQVLASNWAIDKIQNVDFKWLTDSIPAAIGAVKNVGEALLSIAKPIGTAYRNIFPKATADSFLEVANRLKALTATFKLSEDSAKNLERTFSGLFAIINIGKRALLALGRGIGRVVGFFAPAGAGILSFTGALGDFFVAVDQAIGKTNLFNRTIRTIGDIISPVAQVVKNAFGLIVASIKQFIGIDTSALSDFAEDAENKLRPLSRVANGIGTVFNGIATAFKRIAEFLSPVIDVIGVAFTELKNRIKGALTEGDFSPIFDLVNGGLFAGILAGIGKFIKSLTKMTSGGGLLKQIQGLFKGVGDALSAFTSSIKAGTLQKIAVAIAILAGSLLVLSLIPSDKLTGSLTAISILMTELFGSMAVFEKIMGSAGFKGMGKIVTAMIGLSAAVLILSFAMRNLARLDWTGIAKGLVAIAVLSATLVASAKTLSKSSGQLIKGAAGLVVFAVAINVLASAVKKLSSLSVGELTKGLVGVGVLMAELVAFTKLTGKMSIASAAGILVLAAAMLVFASAVRKFGELDTDVIVKGIIAMGVVLLELSAFIKLTGGAKNMIAIGIGMVALSAAIQILSTAIATLGNMSVDSLVRALLALGIALGAVTLALNFMPKNMVSIGLGMLAVAGALVLMSKALQTMGSMTWDEIGRGLVVLTASLGLLAGALYLMTGTIAGAAALLVASAALVVLSGALLLLGTIQWESIWKGLVAIAGVFVLLGAAAAILSPLSLALLAFSAAIAIFGVGILAAGAGLIALSIGLGLLASAGVGGIAALTGLVLAMTAFALLAPAILAISATFLVFAVAITVLAVGLIALSAAFTLLGVSSVIGLDVLSQLAEKVAEISPMTLEFLALGAAFIVFGVGAAVAGVGVLVFGAALVVLGAGLLIVAAAGEAGIDALVAIGLAAVGLLLATPALLAVGAAFLVFGVGALAAGAGALVAGAGFLVLGAGMLLFVASAPGTIRNLGEIALLAPLMLISAPALLALAAAFLVLGAATLVGGAGALVAGIGLKSMADGLSAMSRVKDKSLQVLSDVADMAWDLTKAAPGLTLGGAALLVLGTGAIALGAGLNGISSNAAGILKTAIALKNMSETFEDALNASKKAAPELQKVMRELMTNMVKEIEAARPKMRSAALALMTSGLVIGVRDGESPSLNAIRSLVNTLINTTRGYYSQWRSAGAYSVDGFIAGLNSKVNEAVSAARNLATSTSNAVNNSLVIRSPSRVMMESGGFAGEGFIIGLHPYIAKAADVGEEIGESTIDSLSKVMQAASEIMDADMDTDPVIRPVLDLNEVTKDIAYMNSLFADSFQVSANKAQVLAGAVNPRSVREAEQAPREVKYEFNQVNNSPEALRRLDIYRDSKNLFNQFKELVDK